MVGGYRHYKSWVRLSMLEEIGVPYSIGSLILHWWQSQPGDLWTAP